MKQRIERRITQKVDCGILPQYIMVKKLIMQFHTLKIKSERPLKCTLLCGNQWKLKQKEVEQNCVVN